MDNETVEVPAIGGEVIEFDADECPACGREVGFVLEDGETCGHCDAVTA